MSFNATTYLQIGQDHLLLYAYYFNVGNSRIIYNLVNDFSVTTLFYKI